MAEQEASFTELLEVRLDLTTLQKDLDAFGQMYKAALDKMGEGAPGIINASTIFGSFKTELNSLTGDVKSFVSVLEDSLNAAASSIAETAEKSTQKVARSAQGAGSGTSGKDRAQKLAQDLSIEQEGVQNEYQARQQAAAEKAASDAEKLALRQKALAEEIASEQEGLVSKYEQDQERASQKETELAQQRAEKQKALAEEISLEQEALLTKYEQDQEEAAAKSIRLAEDVAQRQKALAEEIALEQESILAHHEEQQERAAAQDEARQRRQIDLAREIAMEQEAVVREAEEHAQRQSLAGRVDNVQNLARTSRQDATAASHSAAGREASGESKEAAQAAKEAAEQVAEALGHAKAAAAALDEELLAAAENAARLAAESAAANRALAEAGSSNPVGRFMRNAVGDVGELIAGVIRFQVAWAAVGTILTGIGDLIKSPITALKDGVEYLNMMQEKEEQLAAVFNLTARFSNDTAVNLEKSEKSASEVVTQLKQISASKGLNFDALFNATKSLSENGAIGMVGDMQKLVDLSQMFAATVQAARGDINTQRMILSQIPNLMAGNVQGANQLLQVLGLTSAQWQGIRDHALEHKDLVEQLTPIMQPYLDVLNKSADNQGHLQEQLSLMFRDIEGHFAKGLWEAWTNVLKIARDFLVQNKDNLTAMADVMGRVIADWTSLVGLIFKSEEGTNNLNKATGQWVIFIANVVTGFGEIGRVIASLAVMLQGLSKAGLPTLMGDFGKAKDALGEMSDKLTAIRQQGDSAAVSLLDLEDRVNKTGKYAQPQHDDDLSNLHPDSKRNPPDKTKSKKNSEEQANDRAHMEQQLQDAAAVRQAKVDSAEYEFSQRRINEQQLHVLTMSALKEEEVAVKQIIAQYDALISKIPGMDAKKKNTAITQADTQGNRIEAGLAHQENVSKDKLANTNAGISLDAMRSELAEYQRISQLRIQQGRNEGLSLADIARVDAQVHQETATREQAILQAQIQSEAEGSRERLRLQTDYNNSVKNAALQAADDQQNITNKSLQDQLKDTEEVFAQQVEAMRERMQRMRDQMTSGAATTDQQRQALADLAAEYAVLTQQQELYLQGMLKMAQTSGAGKDAVDKITDAVTKQHKASGEAFNNAAKDQKAATTGKGMGDIENLMFGGNITSFSQFGKDVNPDTGEIDGGSKFSMGTAAKEFQNAVKTFSSSTKQIAVAFGSGNNLAGAGAASSAVGDIASGAAKSEGIGKLIGSSAQGALGMLGPLASIGGSVISLFSDIFTAQAKHIADHIKKAFQETVTAYQNGAATLTNTMATVEAQRSEAIAKLSGKKGGQDQLNQLLPTLDQEIASLKNQQAQIAETFMNNLAQLRLNNGLGNDPLSSMLQTWQQINDQVQQYISSGGSAQNAAEALSLTLRQLSTDAYTNLNEGQKQAISDAINMNQLLQQRIDLENQYEQQVNQLLGQDSLQRRASQGVSAGMQIQQLTANYQLQMTQLDAQITGTQAQLDMYREIYNLKTTTADLEAQQNAANLASLQQQIQVLKDYATIYSNISVNPATGMYGMNPSFQNSIGAVTINVLDSGLTQQQMTDSVSQALQNASRSGTSSNFRIFNN